MVRLAYAGQLPTIYASHRMACGTFGMLDHGDDRIVTIVAGPLQLVMRLPETRVHVTIFSWLAKSAETQNLLPAAAMRAGSERRRSTDTTPVPTHSHRVLRHDPQSIPGDVSAKVLQRASDQRRADAPVTRPQSGRRNDPPWFQAGEGNRDRLRRQTQPHRCRPRGPLIQTPRERIGVEAHKDQHPIRERQRIATPA